MPELPEVETVCRGLRPVLEGAQIQKVHLARPDLRFPFPTDFARRLQGVSIKTIKRRAKFLVFELSSGDVLTAHLGMTGRFRIDGLEHRVEPGAFYAPQPPAGHDHVTFDVRIADGQAAQVVYSDPRRFGFMELFDHEAFTTSARLKDLGPEPLSEDFHPAHLLKIFEGKSAPLKAALLDQKVVAGLGNIYVCEALYRAGLSPRRLARTVGKARAERLVAAIRSVLEEAIEAGGSTLRDYVDADGKKGSFQQAFDVYDRAGSPCPSCGKNVSRIVQSGRSTFFCGACQR